MILNETDTPIQKKAYLVPEEYDLFLGGGRGPGKTVALLKLALRHADQYAEKANILFLRTSHKGLSGVISEAQLMYFALPQKPSFNKQDAVFSFPNGATMTFGQLWDEKDYSKYQGHNYSLLILDELTHWPSLRLVDMLQSNLRKMGVKVRTLAAANPGNVGHGAVAERFVFPSKGDMVPFVDEASGRKVVYIHGTYKENPAIDPERYEKNLRAACRGDAALLKAWLDGDWRVVRGAFFSTSFGDKNRVKWPNIDLRDAPAMSHYLAHDQGTARPFVTYLMVEAEDDMAGPDGEYYPRGSIIAVDEATSATEDDLEDGGGMQIPEIAAEIITMCGRWNAKASGVADDALFADTGLGMYSQHFADNGVILKPAKKGLRKEGLAHMREMMASGMPPTEREDPGLYVDERCWYAWATLPYLATSERDNEDLAKSARDHAADALRYGLLRQRTRFSQHPAMWDPAFGDWQRQQNMAKMVKREDQIQRLRRRGVKAADLAALRGGSGTQWRLFK